MSRGPSFYPAGFRRHAGSVPQSRMLRAQRSRRWDPSTSRPSFCPSDVRSRIRPAQRRPRAAGLDWQIPCRSGASSAHRHETGLGEPPQCDEQLAGKCHNHHPAYPPPGSCSALFEPFAKHTLGLVTQPAPRHLNKLSPDPGRTVAADSLVAFHRAARPRGWRHADPTREFPAVAEPAVKDFVRQQGCVVRADPLQPGQCRDLESCRSVTAFGSNRRRVGRSLPNDRVALGLELPDLAFDESQSLHKPQNLTPGARRERRSICCPHLGELRLEVPGAGLQIEDPMQLLQHKLSEVCAKR